MATSASSLDGSVGRDETANVERWFRNFTFKCLQLILQSRIEVKTPKLSKPKEPFIDHFKLSVPDNPIIEEHLKKSLEDVKSFPPKGHICVEIALVTSEGDHMFLETWAIGFNMSSLDMSANRVQHIFTRMGVTLKSLLCATRALPAYKLARNQGEKGGGYTLTHRIYMDKPQTHMLGEGFKTVPAGSVPTAHGLLTVSVSYRTKLLLSTDMSPSPGTAIEVTDNYFMKEAQKVKTHGSPGTSQPLPCSPPSKSPIPRPESPYCFAVSPSSLEKEDNAMRARAEAESLPWAKSSVLHIDELPEPVMGAFSQQQRIHRHSAEPDVPFGGLMRRSVLTRPDQSRVLGEPLSDKHSNKEIVEEKENIPKEPEAKTLFSNLRANLEDEFVMVDKPPFADEEDPSDVRSFLGTMLRAPKLYDNCDNTSDTAVAVARGGSPSVLSVGQYLSDVEELVLRLEEDMPVLDEFCNSVINMDEREEEDDDVDRGFPLLS